jgi:hypothetical protein
MGFVVDKVALIQVFLRLLPSSSVHIIPPVPHTHYFIHTFATDALWDAQWNTNCSSKRNQIFGNNNNESKFYSGRSQE